MNKLRALTAYLLEQNLVLPEQLDSFTEQVSLDLIWKPSESGMHMGDMRYRAVLVMERFAESPVLLMALVGAWLESFDPDRDGLPAPNFAVEPLDSDLFDVELTLEFEEAQHLAEDPDGPIKVGDKYYGLTKFELWTAEHGEVRSHGT
ncbi:phage tail protein [Pseudomonas gingeri NCPPB 3146 = LMG 5327]|uniref:Phage tail protein n=2 Tax=Pseudomonas gingeri TaxID=117681 RepID=A0A7Y8CEF1_9PSED|nr:phage tail protein [Pseudomonas gingeri]NWC16195.1 phage tail protein [Pseudomonas gingeri]PNQ90378.1 phage tail protein [Pseudomonas gingeri NCPPB 3146 = LMG 5327]